MRRRRPPPDLADSKRRLKRIQRDLCTAAGLDLNTLSVADRIRIEQAAFATLARDNLQAKALAGHVIDVAEIERLTSAVALVLPTKPVDLQVRFVDHSDVCVLCRAPLPPIEERTKPDPAVPSVSPPAENVIPLHATAPAPSTPATPAPPSSRRSGNSYTDITAGQKAAAQLLKGETLGELVANLSLPPQRPY
jgi:hypothetical protein